MNNRCLYLECSSGISGDMTVAALLGLGADQDALVKMLESVPVDGFHVEIEQREKCGIMAWDFDVIEDQHQHVHRHLADVQAIIDQTQVNERVKQLAKKMFLIVAEAESRAHGVALEKVHFHEVGAIDSIVDILSAAFCLDNLEIDQVIITGLTEGQGWVQCAHGKLPVPVPAVLNIVEAHGLLLRSSSADGEMVTPTGAAIAAAIRTSEKLPKAWKVIKTGIGAGKKDFPHANVLRAMLIEVKDDDSNQLWILETNVDDCSGEVLGYTADQLMNAGAKDVTFIPVYMKKGRPAYQMSVLTDEASIEAMEELIFLHTTTIGIRKYPVWRSVLKREVRTVQTTFGSVSVKRIEYQGKVRWMPEYESVKKVCEDTGLGFYEVYEQMKGEAERAE